MIWKVWSLAKITLDSISSNFSSADFLELSNKL